jgi:hypothetical protein
MRKQLSSRFALLRVNAFWMLTLCIAMLAGGGSSGGLSLAKLAPSLRQVVAASSPDAPFGFAGAAAASSSAASFGLAAAAAASSSAAPFGFAGAAAASSPAASFGLAAADAASSSAAPFGFAAAAAASSSAAPFGLPPPPPHQVLLPRLVLPPRQVLLPLLALPPLPRLALNLHGDTSFVVAAAGGHVAAASFFCLVGPM